MKKLGNKKTFIYPFNPQKKKKQRTKERNEKPSTSVLLLLLMLVVGFALPFRHKRYKFPLAPFLKNETRRWDISRKKREMSSSWRALK